MPMAKAIGRPSAIRAKKVTASRVMARSLRYERELRP
jgi:hypothetical protein